MGYKVEKLFHTFSYKNKCNIYMNTRTTKVFNNSFSNYYKF